MPPRWSWTAFEWKAILTLVSLHNAQVFRLLLKTSVERSAKELKLFLTGSAVWLSLVHLLEEKICPLLVSSSSPRSMRVGGSSHCYAQFEMLCRVFQVRTVTGGRGGQQPVGSGFVTSRENIVLFLVQNISTCGSGQSLP